MNARYRLVITLAIGLLILWKCVSFFNDSQQKRTEQKHNSPYQNEVIKVTVYYEALCPDSKSFIVNHLTPTFNLLEKYILLELIPYGHAKTIKNSDGSLEFECQHGVAECTGNKIHACGIVQTKLSATQLKFATCMIYDALIPFEAAERCSIESGLDYSAVATCANGNEGSTLLEAYGVRTAAVRPTITFIPTIELNDGQLVPLKKLLKDFKGELCKLYKQMPPECSN